MSCRAGIRRPLAEISENWRLYSVRQLRRQADLLAMFRCEARNRLRADAPRDMPMLRAAHVRFVADINRC
jgi:hypothetical protein